VAANANPNRRPDIQAALKRAKPNDLLSLEALAMIWGVAKSRFVTVKNVMPGFPPPIPQGTSHVFKAKQALKAMLDYETRHDRAAQLRADRQAAILGGMKKARADQVVDQGIPARDLQILNRMATEIEERERNQRAYIPAAEVAMIAGDVFSEISEFMAGLSNKVDPNGLLDPLLRAQIDDHASEALLRFHGKMKKILDADVVEGTPGGAPNRARKPRARRQRA
jgi:hypothetical protein